MSTAKATVGTSPTTTTTKAPLPAEEGAPPSKGRRTRRGLKRLKFQVPEKMPLPLKALWEWASEEQRGAAHQRATAIIATWLGKTSREAAAKELGLSAVRLWQLSQQAVCGLVVGCLKQPRFRGRPPKGGYELGGESVGALKQRIADLERELDASRRMIEVLKALPGNSGRALATGSKTGDGQVQARGEGGGRRRRSAGADDAVATAGGGPEAQGGARP